jgi:hypothetical protein
MHMNTPGSQPQPGEPAAAMTPDQLWPALTEVGAYERHFNDIQSKYRALASTWLLATFGGVGFVLSQRTLELPFDRLVGAGFLGVAGAVGVVLLWVLDLLVYHRLLDAVFVAALKLEADYPQLPRLRTNMVLSLDKEGVLPRVVWFYMAGTGVLLLVATSLFAAALWDEEACWRIVAIGVGAAVTTLALWRMHRVTCAPNAFVAEAAARAQALHTRSS